MANKLKDMTITKVDFVKMGANQYADIEILKSANDFNSEKNKINNKKIKKGVDETMNGFDQTKLSEEELSVLKSLIAKGVIEEDNEDENTKPENDPNENEEETGTGEGEDLKEKKPLEKSLDINDDEGDDVQKSVHPYVKAEIEKLSSELAVLKKYKQDAEDRELMAVAKKYEILGKKPKDLMPVLKSLKALNDGSYESMISVLDESVKLAGENSIFDEIGKSGNGQTQGVYKSINQIEELAAEISKGSPNLSHTQAVAKAWETHPELMEQYDNELGGRM